MSPNSEPRQRRPRLRRGLARELLATPYEVQETPVTRREVRLHGQPISFLETGASSSGPVVVLLHGLAGSSATWRPVLPLLGCCAHVIAPDLLGHGQSAKPHSGDYSLGAYACGLRDLLLDLDLDRATIVGHSFGGGVGMQFAYQFPELTERLVLESSGGLGAEVNIALRAASLPGTTYVLRALTTITPRWLGRLAHQTIRAAAAPQVDVDELARSLGSLADRGALGAFVQTIRGALEWSGQRLDGTDRLYLLADVPVLLIGGSDDTFIPARHTIQAHEALPASRLEIFDHAGHFPHATHPQRFARALLDFITTTMPARADRESLRRQLRARTLT
jgi:pimeloyl-ACP methyl ester carboxylesterase